jgi:cytochrome o ubiquinol oxidase operon protein cyoD
MNQAAVDRSGASRGSFKSYAAGFILSIVLTVIAFAMVMSGTLSGKAALSGIFAAAVVQILVHLHFFLHLDASSTMRWNVLALLLAVLIMTLFVWGTLWIMVHLNYRVR